MQCVALMGEWTPSEGGGRTLTFTLVQIHRKKGAGEEGKMCTEVNVNQRGPKESLPALRLDAHLFRQSGASSGILANSISSASFSFRRGSSALYFWTLLPFASVGCRRFVFLFFLCVCMLVFVYMGPACTRVPLPGSGKRAYLGKCVF